MIHMESKALKWQIKIKGKESRSDVNSFLEATNLSRTMALMLEKALVPDDIFNGLPQSEDKVVSFFITSIF